MQGRRCPRVIAVALFALTSIAGMGRAAEIRVVGTDLLGVEFSKAFYEYAGRNGLRLTLALDGSRPGLEQLRTGRADLALIVLPAAEAAGLRDYTSRAIGYQTVVVLAPAACPVDQITLAQLARVFATAEGARAAVRWGELGATGDWENELILPLAPEVGVGLATEYFRHEVLHDRPFRRDLARYATPRELTAHFGRNSRVLALAAAAPPSANSCKVLRVAGDDMATGIAPTAEALQAGRYPLRLPVQVVFASEHRDAAAAAAPFVFSDAAATAMSLADIVPLPAATRAEQLRAMSLKEKPPK